VINQSVDSLDPQTSHLPATYLPISVTLIEVGLRDGLQRLEPYIPVDQKVSMLNGLINAGLTSIQVTSFVHPKWVPQMADAEEICAQLPPKGEPKRDALTLSGLALNLRGVERAIAAGLDAVDMSFAATETFSQKNTNCGIEDGLLRMQEMSALAKGAGLRVRIGLMVAFGCAYEGHVPIKRVVELTQHIVDMDVDEVVLADSAGHGNPLQVEQTIEAIRPIVGDLPLILHLHDTRGMGIANLYAGLRQGVTRFDTAFGGLGGCPFIKAAKGNIATEDSAFMLQELGIEHGIDLAAVAAISRAFQEETGIQLPGKLLDIL